MFTRFQNSQGNEITWAAVMVGGVARSRASRDGLARIMNHRNPNLGFVRWDSEGTTDRWRDWIPIVDPCQYPEKPNTCPSIQYTTFLAICNQLQWRGNLQTGHLSMFKQWIYKIQNLPYICRYYISWWVPMYKQSVGQNINAKVNNRISIPWYVLTKLIKISKVKSLIPHRDICIHTMQMI